MIIVDYVPIATPNLSTPGITQLNESCTEFREGDYQDIGYYQIFLIESNAENRSFYMSYELIRGLLCGEKRLIYSTSSGCLKTQPCDWLETLPNEKRCYVRCRCEGTQCHGVVLVEPMINSEAWLLCYLGWG